MGAKMFRAGFIDSRADRLVGFEKLFDFPMWAHENLINGRRPGQGTSVQENAAEDPDVDLANFLNSMGAKIKGAGTKVIRVEGVDDLFGAAYGVIPDRIEAGTFLVAGAMSGGDLLIENVICDHINPVLAKLREAGVRAEEGEGCVRVPGEKDHSGCILRQAHPGFPPTSSPILSHYGCPGGQALLPRRV
jgi:UDP-N-acetylglucosamine 1-carboxyvinyltransferase